MPELPDLTVFAENLRPALVGKRIVQVDYRASKNAKTTQQELADALVGAAISSVERVGKRVCFGLDNGNRFFVHLMLTGAFLLTGVKERGKIRAPVFTAECGDGSLLAVADEKGWANVALNAEPDGAPDALEVTAQYLRTAFAKKPKTLVKAFLLDQKVIGGIGNAYSDEILWHARISPKSPVGKIPADAVEALAAAIPAVLGQATAYLRKNHPGIVSGEYREHLEVHSPGRKKSPTGFPIVVEQVQSKKTYYTEEQILYR